MSAGTPLDPARITGRGDTRPNILLIITDQQRFDTIAALGYPHVDTPHLDQLVSEGTAFTRMYVTAPSCAPSRASLFSGMYPHSTGVLRNEEVWNHSWVEALASSGYRCVNVGKMHTYPYEAPIGFHERHVVENKDRDTPRLPFYLDTWDKALWARGLAKPSRVTYSRRADYGDRLGAFEWELPADMHADNFVGNLACMWLQRWTGSEPFFLQIGFPGPHPPYDPIPSALDAYRDRDVPMPHHTQRDLDAQPEALKAMRRDHQMMDHDAIVHLESPADDQLRRQRRHYLANVSMIDAQIGAILAALEERGVLDNTVILFTSDHGDCLNDHGHSQKWTMYEPSVRVPAIVWGRERVQAGQVLDGLTSMMDFGPTILELAGLQPPEWMEARSLVRALSGEAYAGRGLAFSEHARDSILTGAALMTMVTDGTWKLVEYLEPDDGQLFNLVEDPYEEHDLWHLAKYDHVKQEMLRAIAHWRAASEMHTSTWAAKFR